MTQQEFLSAANHKLSPDPMSRVTAKARHALENPNCIFDTHCHIFDKHCVNEFYFLLRVLKEWTGIEKMNTPDADKFRPHVLQSKGCELLTKTEEQIYRDLENQNSKYSWEKIEYEINLATAGMEGEEGFSLGGLWQTLRKVVFKDKMEKILEFYLQAHAVTNLPEYAGRPFVTSILLMDLETGWGKPINKSIFTQIDEVKKLTQTYPLLPYVAIDPRRAKSPRPDINLYQIVLYALTTANPFFGIKVYPSLGYLPNDERLWPIYEICQEFNIPVLTHCGGNIVSTFENPVEVNDGGQVKFIRGANRQDVAHLLNDPANWIPVLERFPSLKLNLGHFGSNDVWQIYPKKDSQNRIDTIIELMGTYDNVFADFSFNVIDNSTFDNLKKVLDRHEKVRTRTLFGTDYWVILPSGNLSRAQEEFIQTLGSQHMEALLAHNPRQYLLSIKA